MCGLEYFFNFNWDFCKNIKHFYQNVTVHNIFYLSNVIEKMNPNILLKHLSNVGVTYIDFSYDL